MKFNKRSIAAAAFVAFAGAAHAAPETFTLAEGESQVSNGRVFSDLSGTSTWRFSSNMVSFVNIANISGFNADSLQAVPDAVVHESTSTNATGRVKLTSASAAAPITALTSSFDGTTFTLQGVGTSGGVLLTTVKNNATLGAGSLSISDLKVDLSTKTIYADIVGANGVGTLDDHALWTFSTVSASASFDLSASSVVSSNLTLSGLFLANATDLDTIFVKALNLNNLGRAALTTVARQTTSNTMGFGAVDLALSVSAVPEPSSYALMGVGLVGLALLGRRRAGR